MKTTFLQIGFGLFLLFACGKQFNSSVNDKRIAIQSFKQLNNRNDKRMAFDLLSEEEKIDVITTHILFCKNYFDLTARQTDVMEYVAHNLETILSSGDAENNREAQDLEVMITQYFSDMNPDSLRLIFDTVIDNEADANEFISNSGTSTDPMVSDCNCSASSNWCTLTYDNHVKCLKPCKTSTAYGCGTLWLYACKGKCTVI